MKHTIGLLISVILLTFVGAGRTDADALSYAISGHAHRMPEGGSASRARICAVGDNASLCQLTNEDGVFNLEPLPPGTYTVDATLAGYYTECPDHYTVQIVNQSKLLEVALWPDGSNVTCYTVHATPSPQ